VCAEGDFSITRKGFGHSDLVTFFERHCEVVSPPGSPRIAAGPLSSYAQSRGFQRKPELIAGRDFLTRGEIQQLLASTADPFRPFLITPTFTRLRAG
jgi:hypothetical protein